jgi:CHAD domain-containing protein
VDRRQEYRATFLRYNFRMASVHPELEIKYDVDDDFELPPLAGLVAGHGGVAPVTEGEAVTHHLEATYFDTADHRLARARLTLRRRTGGDDAGWHLKVPGLDGARQEVRVALGRSTATVPSSLRKLVWASSRGEALVPVARIVTDRTVRTVIDATGHAVVEVSDDRVQAQRLQVTDGDSSSAEGTSAWREIEVELRSADREWLDLVDASLRELGVRVADSGSKLARVLDVGGTTAEPGRAGAGKAKRPSPKSPAGDVVVRYIREQVDQILTNDPQVRVDTPDTVHKMRVATRRLRSALQTFKPVLRADAVRPLRSELKWLAGELGAARDAEVLRDRLLAAVADESRDERRGALGDSAEAEMTNAYRTAHDALLQALDSDRYHRLVTALDELVTCPPLTGRADQPAAKVLPRRAARAYDRLRSLVDAIHQTPPGEERERHLHEARKAAKKARYAGETMAEFFGKPAARFAGAMETVQDELGEHQDSVVMRTRIEQLADQEASPAAAFAYGRLHAHEERRGEVAVERFEAAWTQASKKSLRRWIA